MTVGIITQAKYRPLVENIRGTKLVDLDNFKYDNLPQFLINFLGDRIIRDTTLLKRNIVNFHPAPPSYRGRGGASRALYDRQTTFGITVHIMEAEIDSGRILLTKSFSIRAGDTCDSLFGKAISMCVGALYWLLEYIEEENRLPLPQPISWSGELWDTKRFQEWLVLRVDFDPVHAQRLIAATKSTTKPGPYLKAYGHKFEITR